MARTKHQVFVSSTYRGLEDERRLVMQALLEMNCIPSGMELFPASSDEVWELIEGVIGEADYYVLIVGGRYGSTDADGVSYTEREYDLAVRSGVPVLPFLHGDPGKIPAELSEMDPAGREKLTAFRGKVESAHHCKYWTSVEGLAGAVSRSLNHTIQTHPRHGWVRGDMAKTVEDVEKVGKLQEQVRELERQLETFENKADDERSGFSQGEDVIPPEATLLEGDYAPSEIRLTWNHVFRAVAEQILSDPGESLVALAVQRRIELVAHAADKPTPFLRQPQGVRGIKRQFLALNLIDVDHIPNPNSARGRMRSVWRLTPRGQRHFARLTAISRASADGAKV
jgi:hypothetical protein